MISDKHIYEPEPSQNRCGTRQAYTLIELLAVIFVIALAVPVYVLILKNYGPWPAATASVLGAFIGGWLVTLLYRWSWKCDRQRLAQLRKQYRTIYRVKALPTDAKGIIKPEGAEIQIGDYGWDARPNREDGLIHLQGLTLRWQVVWHAGFRDDQIEKVTDKPASQYDHWVPYWQESTPPSCPFPVLERSTPTMGLPHHSGYYFEDCPSQYYQSPKDMPTVS